MDRQPIEIHRKAISIDDETFYPVYKFEGIYEMSITGVVRRVSDQYLVHSGAISNKTGFDMVVVRHPDGNGSSLLCNLLDVWLSTFTDDKAMDIYSYVNEIKS